MFESNQFFGGGGAAEFYSKKIDQSLRFNNDDTAYLTRTNATSDDDDVWSWSAWVKRGHLGTTVGLFSAGSYSSPYESIYFSSGDLLEWRNDGGAVNHGVVRASGVFRDPSAWYHIVVVRNGGTVTIYVNGEDRTTNVSSITASTRTMNDSGALQRVGAHERNRYPFDGYLAEIFFIDGQVKQASDFGELKSGVWIPKAYSGTFGTNGFHLDFGNSADIGNDVSGQGNDWTPNNLAAADVVLDSPTDNYCTWNPLSTSFSGATLSDGNLRAVTGTSQYGALLSTFAVSSGKYYVEFNDVSGSYSIFGCFATTKTPSTTTGLDSAGTGSIGYKKNSGNISIDGTETSYGASWSNGDVIGMALNLDDNEVTFYKNGSSQGTRSISALEYYIAASDNDGGSGITVVLNAGQSGFTYTPPTGFNALSTANLPDPVLNPADDASPADHFGALIWSGDDNASRTIATGATGVTGDINFTPDFSWIKRRNGASNGSDHMLLDAVRGVGSFNAWSCNGYEVEGLTEAGSSWANFGDIASFTTDGFTVQKGSDPSHTLEGINQSGGTYVGWNWKASGSGSDSTSDMGGAGSGASSTTSANADVGIGITKYYIGSSPDTYKAIPHGLGAIPEFIIIKNLDSNQWPVVHHHKLNANGYFNLGSNTNGESNDISVFRTGYFDGTNFYVGTANETGAASTTFIAYCFVGKEGFSKFGQYSDSVTGSDYQNTSPFVYCGFKPAWLFIRSKSAGRSFAVWDNQRSATNPAYIWLQPDTTTADQSDSTNMDIDFCANGFKIRGGDGRINTTGEDYVFAAFAESPFKFSTAR